MEGKLHTWLALLAVLCGVASAQLKPNFYANTCPNVESIVRKAVQLKFQQTPITVPATLRLFFHDCMVNGCDASVIIQSTSNNTAEKDHPDNLSLAGDGFDTVIKAKAAVDATPGCTNKVSCADILAIAARDVVNLAGGPSWTVELGRRDGLVSTSASVNGKLPQPSFNLNQLNSMFSKIGLTQNDMVALSGAHTVGFSHCSKFSNRLYSFSQTSTVDPTLNPQYATQLKQMCPKSVDPRIAVSLDPNTPNAFDNVYYKNLMNRQGLLTSDQVLFEDSRSKAVVVDWAQNTQHFNQAFTQGMVKLGRVGVKTGTAGNIRINCPNVEKIVRNVVQKKFSQTFVTIPAVLRLFFHDCAVNGCDASIMIASTPRNKAEKDHPDNLSLAGDGFDTVIKAKEALEKTPGCKRKVSCADILAIAARDVINLAGGPFYTVELGRLDGLVSTTSSVHLPGPAMNLDKQMLMYRNLGMGLTDLVALAGAHTLGFAHCGKFSNRLYNFSPSRKQDPTLNPTYASDLKKMCPRNVDPRIAVNMDPTTPRKFDNVYFKNLMNGRGLFTSDQVLFQDKRSRPLVVDWAQNAQHFNQAFVKAITNLGRVGVKTSRNGNIRLRCDAFN
ncbi:hypothetical protein V2J09_021585 [Rumex salicifolius]